MAIEIDQQFIEYVVKSLVGNPDKVQIERRIDEKGVLLELTVDPDDLGRVIGKRGATAQSLRTLLRALGTKNDARYNLKIIDNGTGPSSSEAPPVEDSAASQSAVDTNDESQPTAEQSHESSAPSEADSSPVASAADEQNAESSPEDDTSGSENDRSSDRFKRTREELADLDDLDV
jgi:predicted RNA-binding protein YlqC (UPF0109 family)